MPRHKVVPVTDVALDGVGPLAAIGCEEDEGHRLAFRSSRGGVQVRVAEGGGDHCAVCLRAIRDCVNRLSIGHGASAGHSMNTRGETYGN